MTGIKKKDKSWFKKPSLEVSERMRKIKSAGTKLEKAMEAILRANKIRFARQPDLQGKPDFLIKDAGLLVFCDSSFWHGRRKNELNGEAFKKNRDFWVNKLKYNRIRDTRVSRCLRREGWSVYRFWDTDILKHPDKVARRLVMGINKNDQS